MPPDIKKHKQGGINEIGEQYLSAQLNEWEQSEARGRRDMRTRLDPVNTDYPFYFVESINYFSF